MILLAGFGGLRLGELLALREQHVDLKTGTVTVTEQVVNLAGGHRLVTEPKTEAGRRVVALPQLVIDALAEHLRLHDPDAPLFPAEDGGLLPATTFYKHWRRARHQVGRDDLHLHDLRHVAGTLAAWTGATERELMARLGHANPPRLGATSTRPGIGTGHRSGPRHDSAWSSRFLHAITAR